MQTLIYRVKTLHTITESSWPLTSHTQLQVGLSWMLVPSCVGMPASMLLSVYLEDLVSILVKVSLKPELSLQG